MSKQTQPSPTASTIGPCPTIWCPSTVSLPSTFAPPNHPVSVGVSKMFKFYIEVFYVMGKMLAGELSCVQVILSDLICVYTFYLSFSAQILESIWDSHYNDFIFSIFSYFRTISSGSNVKKSTPKDWSVSCIFMNRQQCESVTFSMKEKKVILTSAKIWTTIHEKMKCSIMGLRWMDILQREATHVFSVLHPFSLGVNF